MLPPVAPVFRTAAFFLTAIVAGVAPRSVLADGATPRAVAILEQLKASADVKRELRGAVARSVQLLGANPVPHAVWEAPLKACGEDKVCAISAGRDAGADVVLIFTGRHGDQSFELRAELWDAGTGRLVGEVSKDCGLCSLKDLYEAAEDQSASLLARAGREPAAVEGGAGGAGGTVERPGDTGAVDTAGTERTPAMWGGLVAGGLVAVAGSLLWIIDGDGARCHSPPNREVCSHDKQTPGSPWLGPTLTIGGLLGAGAAAFFLFGGSF